MKVQNVMGHSVGEWAAICRHWKQAHQDDSTDIDPPTEEEFEAAIVAVRNK